MTLAKIKKIKDIVLNIFDNKSEVVFISETNDWIIQRVCYQVTKFLNKNNPRQVRVSLSCVGLKNKIVHFGSVGSFFINGKLPKINYNNKIVLTWFHVLDDDKRLKYVPEINTMVNIVHTSCQKSKDDLIRHGVLAEKIVVIPIGINLGVFKQHDKDTCKKKYKLPADKIIIGSFQKDGDGWGEGLAPKLIKGPDIFCDVVEKLAKKYDIHILLSGPARGYVKQRLESAKIPYTHKYFKNYLNVAKFFNCLDLYIVSSRVEGGPRAVVESWASGVPLISTKVGMAIDIVKNKENGILADVEDVDGLVYGASMVLDDESFRSKLVNRGLSDVKSLDWSVIAVKYNELIYKKIK